VKRLRDPARRQRARLMPVFGKGGRNATGGIPHEAVILALVMAAISEAPYSPLSIVSSLLEFGQSF
jgi:hypothetical protein